MICVLVSWRRRRWRVIAVERPRTPAPMMTMVEEGMMSSLS